MANVCVIGGGPAGSVFAARMAQLRHAVTLVERCRLSCRRLGESLSPGIWPLLETIGAHDAVASAGFHRVPRVEVHWDGSTQIREDPRAEALIVDRGRFDRLLLDAARSNGVRVVELAQVVERRNDGGSWVIGIRGEAGPMQLRADFIADASGRSAFPSHRRRTAPSTLALYAWWRGAELPAVPRIEAGEHGWFWYVSLPDGTVNVLAFVDVEWFRLHRSGSLQDDYLGLLRASSQGARLERAQRITPVRGIDATPYLEEDSVSPASIRVGEAAMSIDPISSSGVQKAMQSALAAAVVANTLLRRPASTEVAIQFYRTHLAEASGRHGRWAAGHYAAAAAQRSGSFWQVRAQQASSGPVPEAVPVRDSTLFGTADLALSPQLEFVSLPCLERDFVETRTGVLHPRLESPLVYLGGHELAPLLRLIRPGSSALRIAQDWSDRLPPRSGLAIAGWLFNNGLLVCHPICAGR